MAETIVRGKNFYDISAIDRDITWDTIVGSSVLTDTNIIRLEFKPGADDDHCVIKQGDENGPVIVDLGSDAAPKPDRLVYPRGRPMIPFVDYDKGTFNAGHRLLIEIE